MTTPTIHLRDLAPGDAGWVVMAHGELYARDEGYDQRFEGLVAGIVADFIAGYDAARHHAWIAHDGDQRLGCVFCVADDAETARLRLFLVTPDARGTGLSKRLIEACIAFARQAGYRHLVLWTHESHRAACALYARYGFVLTSSQPGHDFGVDVVDQNWDLTL